MTILITALLTVSAVFLFVAGYYNGVRDGYSEAWADIVDAHKQAEKESHQWPDEK